MGDDDCIHGLDPRWCGVCLHGVTKPAEGPRATGRRMGSRFESTCTGCHSPVRVGEFIGEVRSGDSVWWVHESCLP